MQNDDILDFGIEMISGEMGEEDTEFIPLLSDDDITALGNSEIPEDVEILALKNIVVFPGIVLPVSVGRKKSLQLIKKAFKEKSIFASVAQRSTTIEYPQPEDIFDIGTTCRVIKLIEMPDKSTTAIIQGIRRVKVEDIQVKNNKLTAKAIAFEEEMPDSKDKNFQALIESLKDLTGKIIDLSNNIPNESAFAINNIESKSFLINFISTNTDLKVESKQKLLASETITERGINLLGLLSKEIQILELKTDIQKKVTSELDQQHKEYVLNQQIKTIQNELGGSAIDKDIEELKEKAKNKKWPEVTKASFEKELEKLGRLNTSSPEYGLQINYLQTLTDLPWDTYTKDKFNLKRAQKVLDSEHYGIEEVKERIIEYLAVLKLKGDMKSPIICLHGPPGVGKTSLGKSVANAIGRKYARMSLGGVHDESEIRGHRKTYIGAMPGRIIQNIKKAKSSNPVFILDEVDKLGQSAHGDPSSALLEVLDPEQNSTFYDNYLEMEYDLSKVLFIATANDLSAVPTALLDRMELIEVSGYVMQEKVEIAKRHIIPQQLEKHGIEKSQLKLSKPAIEKLIESYTRESGVRALNHKIAKISRSIARKIAVGEEYSKTLTPDHIKEILGSEDFSENLYQGNDYLGVVTGLAWTSVGGKILFVETSVSKGKGKLTLTGNLGDVMKESAMIALEYIKANAEDLGIESDFTEKLDFHIHVPEGAIPKDGPSAGVTMITSIASAVSKRKVKKFLAMSGEMTLRGKVLPVGGIKEKILAAKRSGIKEIILSSENKKDIEEIKPEYLTGVTFKYVENVKEVLDLALI